VSGSASPDGQIFRNIMEAYGVLSVNESRASYDLTMRKDPDAYKQVSEAEFS
jgi:DnaJ-class molecular chaperone